MGRRFLAIAISVLVHGAAVWAQPVPAGPESQVNTFTILSQFDPDAAVLANGDVVVVFTDFGQEASFSGIFARRFDSAGNPLDPNEFLVNAYVTGAQAGPAVAADGAGGFVVVWASLGQDGDGFGIFGRAFDSAGAPTTGDFQVNQYTTGYQSYPAVSMNSRGDFVVTWVDAARDGHYAGVFGRAMSVTGSPRGPEFQVNLTTTNQQTTPAVGIDEQGDFVVVWNSYYQDGSGAGIFGRRFDSAGSPLTGEFQVNEYTLGLQKYPNVAMHASGEFVVVWSSFGPDGSGYTAAGRRFHRDARPAGPEFAANAYTTSWQQNPDVGMDAAGNFVVVWQDRYRDGDYSGIFAGLLDAGGAPTGVEFQVNTYTTGYQHTPAVGMGPAGDFVAAWWSYGQDGQANGVFAQRYAPPDPCGLLDADGDGMGDACDVAVLAPIGGESLDCADPRSGRPWIVWNGGDYDRFRIEIAWDTSFGKGLRVTSGSELKRGFLWRPSTKKWRKVCRNASPDVFVRVLGVDRERDRLDPDRKNYSNVIQAEAVN